MTRLIRLQLGILMLVELVVGAWNQLLPESFYRTFPTVDLTPPFSEHDARDFGGASLGIAAILAIPLVPPRTAFVIPAALTYSVYSLPRFYFHLTHLEGGATDPGDRWP